ncbi:MAG: sigma-70 family RNA polymerase sigma factor [Thermoanaerobaculia bacterium]|nr:sigma-70 family RNA polymerase sigma factor [Thermoanaerobaculia bacterium]
MLFAVTFSQTADETVAPLAEPSSELEEIFQSFHGKVFAAAYRVTGSAQDAEDVLQTVFLRLLKRQDTLDLAPNPGAYLHRAAVNASLDLIRSKARSSSLPLDDLSAQPAEAESRSPERSQHDRELRRSLRLAITGLTAKSAEIFVLRFFEGQANKEIADQLGMTQAAVGVALHRARNQVKEEIRSFVGEN